MNRLPYVKSAAPKGARGGALALLKKHHYVNQSGMFTIGDTCENDARDFDEITAALARCQLADLEAGLFTVVAAIVHLGDVEFEPRPDDSGGKVVVSGATGASADAAATGACARAAELLGVSAEALAMKLCSRTFSAGAARGSMTTVEFNADQAVEARDALAKALYGKLFDWLISAVNDACADDDERPDNGGTSSSISVLDIFGFEIFETNSFEQLCINYTNEHLQRLFNTNVFERELALYTAEGLPLAKSFTFKDNQVTLDLISNLLKSLDEEAKVPRGSSKGWVSKVAKAHATHAAFLLKKTDTAVFTVLHYAGRVEYRSDHFYPRNLDALSDDIHELMGSSSHAFICRLLEFDGAQAALASGAQPSARKGKKIETVAKKFETQLKQLVSDLDDTMPHYIRCIKPNSQKLPAPAIDGAMTSEQLLYSGVFETGARVPRD